MKFGEKELFGRRKENFETVRILLLDFSMLKWI